MARRSLVWRGREVTAKMRAAQIAGVNATMGASVVEAKNSHAWKNRSGTLEGGIGITDFAREERGGVRGLWGVQDVVYALIHELGGTIVPKTAADLAIPQADGSVRLVKSVTIPPRPYLRPAADAKYPGLAANIRRAFAASTARGGGSDG